MPQVTLNTDDLIAEVLQEMANSGHGNLAVSVPPESSVTSYSVT